jgi:hypothetical protein
MRGMFVFRVVISVLAIGLGIAFIARGDYLIGVLVLFIALSRGVMMLMMTKRRQEARAVIRARRRLDG